MQTISEFIKRENVEVGNKLTDGERIWIVAKSTSVNTRGELYLKGHNERGVSTNDGLYSTIACTLLDFLVIPNLKVFVGVRTVYLYAYKEYSHREISVSNCYYESYQEFYKSNEGVEWVEKIDKTRKNIFK